MDGVTLNPKRRPKRVRTKERVPIRSVGERSEKKTKLGMAVEVLTGRPRNREQALLEAATKTPSEARPTSEMDYTAFLNANRSENEKIATVLEDIRTLTTEIRDVARSKGGATQKCKRLLEFLSGDEKSNFKNFDLRDLEEAYMDTTTVYFFYTCFMFTKMARLVAKLACFPTL